MTRSGKSILLTRPVAQSRRFAAACETRFGPVLPIVISPLMQIEILTDPSQTAPSGALIFTSENGVKGFAHHWSGINLPTWCVGQRTAFAAQQIGLQLNNCAETAEALIADILADADNAATPFVHFRGEHARGDVVGALCQQGIRARARVIYKQLPRPLTDEAQNMLRGTASVILPLFSPRTAVLFCEQVQIQNNDLHIIAFSAAVSNAISGFDKAEIHICERPHTEAMLDEITQIIVA